MTHRAISLWQPWASAIPMGLKKNETRGWSTDYRGPLVIHAAKTKFHAYKYPGVFLQGLHRDGIRFSELPYGALICIADLVDVVPTDGIAVTDKERMYGDYAPGRFAWKFENVQAFQPIPCIGRQGFFSVTIPEPPLFEGQQDMSALHGGGEIDG